MKYRFKWKATCPACDKGTSSEEATCANCGQGHVLIASYDRAVGPVGFGCDRCDAALPTGLRCPSCGKSIQGKRFVKLVSPPWKTVVGALLALALLLLFFAR